MKNYIIRSLMLLVMTGGLALPQMAVAQNTLHVADFTAAAGKQATVPIFLDNADEVVGLQFDIELPYNKANGNVTLVDERINGHSLSLRHLGNNTRYTVVVMSMQNLSLRGNGGLLVRFPMQVPEGAQADETKEVKLSNIVLTDRSGANIATNASQTAIFTVLRTPKPDFVVESLSITNNEETLTPGGKLRLSFNVLNQGTGDSKDGWSEKIYIEDLTGTRTYVTTQHYGNPLPAGERMNRFYEVDIPQAMHIEGTVHAVVELTALNWTDELIADQGNNISVSANTKELGKKLFLSTDRIRLREGSKERVTLTRSGDWSMDETFELSEQNTHGEKMLTLPLTVTIPAKSAAATFYVTATNNNIVNTEFRSGFVVKATHEYDDVSMIVDVDDDDSHTLTLETDKIIYHEGDPLTLTVSLDKVWDTDTKVQISNTVANCFTPSIRSITIPAGKLSASATTRVVEDDYPMVDQQVKFIASADGFVTASRNIAIQDDDWPTLSMSLSRTIISEDDGYGATMATVTRKGNTVQNLTVYLNYTPKSVPSGANTRELFFDSQYVIIPAGQTSVSFPISVEDNSNIEGERKWNIIAAGCDASTGKPVGVGSLTYCTSVLTVTDNDTGVVLKLQCGTGTLTEGGSKATLTLSRNSTQGSLTVNLTGDGGNLDMPSTVTIPNGQQSTTFQVGAKADLEQENNYYARVTASATNCQPAQFVFMVSTQADAICTLNDLNTVSAFGGQTVDVTLNVQNQGTSSLPAGIEVRFYLMDRNTYNGNTKATEVLQTTFSEAIAAKATKSKTFSIVLPEYVTTGRYYLMAWLNPRQNFAESNKGNNQSNTVPVDLKPAFTLATVKTDGTDYTRGDVITITGRMSNNASRLPMAGKQVDVYLRNDTKRYQTTTTLDANGNFTAQYTFGEQTGGHYKVGACVHATGGTSATEATVNVIRLRIDRSSYLLENIIEGIPLEGDIPVTNLSEEPLTNVSFQMKGLPEGWEVELTTITNLAAGHTGNAHYRIVTPMPDAGKTLVSGTFVATAKDGNGRRVADSEMPVYFWWYAAESKLAAENVRTTLYRNGQRTLKILVENVGLKETGSIAVEWSSDQSWLSVPATQMASIAKDGKAVLTLNLTGSKDMIVDGTYQALVRLKPQNGPKLDVEVKCTVVSTDVANLTVDVVDAYTLGADDGNGPHVAGASVRLTNALTGEVAMTGTTDENGLFYTDGQIKEGTYYVYVTAPNHYYAEKTVTLNAGVENQLEVFLNYEVVKMTYTVERTTVTEEYRTVLSMDIVPDIPQAIVIPDMPENWGTGNHAYSVRLTNKGRLTAYTPHLEFPIVEGMTFKVLSDYPAVLYPNESYDVTVEFNGPETCQVTSLGYIRMHYAFKLQGETYWAGETYAATMGSGNLIQLPNGGLPTASSDAEGHNFGEYTPPKGSYNQDAWHLDDNDTGNLDSSEPEILVRDYTHSVDNRIRLQFEQKLLLEREAFKGTLKVENLQMSSIEDITLIPNVKKTDGTDVTELFSITTTGTGNWNGNEGWNLASSGVGNAQVLYVPSKDTAPAGPVDYLFGGTVTYRNVADGKLVVCELTPTQLTVHPSPDLHLTYFVQRDFIGDDPLTEEVEPSEPAQFALLIHNKGAGKALNVQIETSNPTIVDNACNLPVEFTKLYCTVDGEQSNMDFNKLNLGSIEGGQSIMIRWWYSSNVAAHVANYDVRLLNHSVFGADFDLITIDGVYELTQSVMGGVEMPENQKKAKAIAMQPNTDDSIFLLNLIPDEDNLPDHVIDMTGNETDDVEIVSQSVTVHTITDNSVYQLQVTASRPGWVYGVIHDPTNCVMRLTKVVRECDGADITANVWQTERSVTANYSTIVDNRLHWADNINTNESYLLYYEPKPAAAPQVERIELVAEEGSPKSKATQALVTFAEPIDMETLDAEDVVVMNDSKSHAVIVTPVNATTCRVDWSKNRLYGGEYTLTVFTSGISNLSGISGSLNKSLTWMSDGNFVRGDVNGNGKVDSGDLDAVTTYMSGQENAVTLAMADVNEDSKVGIADIIAITDAGSGANPTIIPTNTKGQTIEMTAQDVTIVNGKTAEMTLSLRNSKEIAGWQMYLYLPDGVSIAPGGGAAGHSESSYDQTVVLSSRHEQNHRCSVTETADGGYLIMAYAPNSPTTISQNSGELVTITLQASVNFRGEQQAVVNGIAVSDTYAMQTNLWEELTIPIIAKAATGITEVRTASTDTAVYDLTGCRLSSPVKGINIVNRKKIVVR